VVQIDEVGLVRRGRDAVATDQKLLRLSLLDEFRPWRSNLDVHL